MPLLLNVPGGAAFFRVKKAALRRVKARTACGMKCVRCDQLLTAGEEHCPQCGYSLEAADLHYGHLPVRLERISADGVLTEAETAALLESVAGFESEFPQLCFAAYVGLPPEGESIRQFAFWLLNHAEIFDAEKPRRNSNAILLVLDPVSGEAVLMIGYLLENYFTEVELTTLLGEGRESWVGKRWKEGVGRVIAELSAVLRRKFNRQIGNRGARRTTAAKLAGGVVAGFGVLGFELRAGVQENVGPPHPQVLQEESAQPAENGNPDADTAHEGMAEDEYAHDDEEAGKETLKLLDQLTLQLPGWGDAWMSVDGMQYPLNLGGGLFPPDLWPLEPEPFSWVEVLPNASHKPVALTDELIQSYFAKPPQSGLLDPQALLHEQTAEELRDFFKECELGSGGAKIRLLVFDAGQQLPEGMSLEALTAGWFPEQEGILACYWLKEAERSQINFSPALLAKYEAEGVATRWQEDCRREAVVATEAQTQCTRFALKVGLLARKLSDVPVRRTELPGGTATSIANESSRWKWMLPGVLVLALASILWGWKRRRPFRKTGPCLLPEPDFVPRLMAPHCGGTHAYLKFR